MSSSVPPAILLAGGQSSRLGGGDKSLRRLGNQPILAHVINALRPQTGAMVLNANGDPRRFDAFGLGVVPDDVPEQPGPLAGILAGLDWAAAAVPGADFALSVSCDCPFLPADLVARLRTAQAAQGGDIVAAESRGRLHPVIALWRVSLRTDLRQALVEEGVRKVELFCARHRLAVVNFPARQGDPFFNINTEEDLAAAEHLLAAGAIFTNPGIPS